MPVLEAEEDEEDEGIDKEPSEGTDDRAEGRLKERLHREEDASDAIRLSLLVDRPQVALGWEVIFPMDDWPDELADGAACLWIVAGRVAGITLRSPYSWDGEAWSG